MNFSWLKFCEIHFYMLQQSRLPKKLKIAQSIHKSRITRTQRVCWMVSRHHRIIGGGKSRKVTCQYDDDDKLVSWYESTRRQQIGGVSWCFSCTSGTNFIPNQNNNTFSMCDKIFSLSDDIIFQSVSHANEQQIIVTYWISFDLKGEISSSMFFSHSTLMRFLFAANFLRTEEKNSLKISYRHAQNPISLFHFRFMFFNRINGKKKTFYFH